MLSPDLVASLDHHAIHHTGQTCLEPFQAASNLEVITGASLHPSLPHNPVYTGQLLNGFFTQVIVSHWEMVVEVNR